MEAVDKLCNFYERLDRDSIKDLGEIYADAILFTDPVHELEGLDNLKRYFANLCRPGSTYRFDILSKVTDSSSKRAFLCWQMHYQHPKLANNKPLMLRGASHLEFESTALKGKVTRHEDFYDLGAMLYEHIPVLGWAVKNIKRRLEPSDVR